MAHQQFETVFAETQFHVTNLSATVFEGSVMPSPPLPAPLGIIRSDQDWGVHLKWTTEGSLVPTLPGQWHLNLWLESMGPGDEVRLPGAEVHIDLTPGPSPVTYEVDINIPAGTVPPPNHTSQPYKLVATITYSWCEKPLQIGPMAGYVEGPILQFYRPS